MIETAEVEVSRRTARELLRFLEEMMRTIAQVDLDRILEAVAG